MGRVRKDCPLLECEGRNLLRLASHLSRVHKLHGDEKRIWLQKAKHSELQSLRIDGSASWNGEAEINKDPWWQKQSLVPFEPCSSVCVSGATNSGKTFWIYKFLKRMDGMFAENTPVEVLYCYGIYQSLFEEMEKTLPNITFHEGLPSSETISEFTKDERHRIVVIDDLMHQVTQNTEMELLFTQGSHHKHITILYLVQNLYCKGKSAKTIQLNTGYLVLFKNVRDSSQLITLGRQMFPKRSQILIQAYEDVMKKPYGYLVIDMMARSDDKYRLRSHVFPGEDCVIYLPKT